MPGPHALRRWLRRHPLVGDGAIALVVAAVCLAAGMAGRHPGVELPGRAPDSVSLALALAATAPLLLRRRCPVAVLLSSAVASTAEVLIGYQPAVSGVATLVAVYAVGAYVPLARGISVLLAALAVGDVLHLAAEHGPGLGDVAVTSAVTVGVWWMGRAVRLRRLYTAELEARATRLERARDAYARAALAEERSRIARELHDVVAHHVSVMTVQAAAAQRVLARSPDSAREAMAAIEHTGRAALREMRRIVDVLRTDGHAAAGGAGPEGRAPQPGVGDIPALVAQVRETGLDVRLETEGTIHPLPAGIDLAAFRVVQEALTNTLKHAGPGATAEVTLRYSDGGLDVGVRDDGRGLAAGLAGARGDDFALGHGMLGMRERVGLYGGDLRAGARPGGGFEVRARFPLEPAADAEPGVWR